MQTISFTMEAATGPFEVPYSTGYQTYSGLLSVLDSVSDHIADDLHEAPFTALVNSGLLGDFRHDTDRDYHKKVRTTGSCQYNLELGVVHPDDRDVFEALMRAFVIEDRNLPLAHGEMEVAEVSTDRSTHDELLSQASELADEAEGVRFTFKSPTCRQRYGEVWEINPHRASLFQHLAGRWNAATDTPELELSPTEETLGEELFTKVDSDSYDTHSIVVHRDEPTAIDEGVGEQPVASDGGHLSQIQGFTGEFDFIFKDASEATRTAVLALAQFANYSGVGRHNARGSGSISTEILGCDL
jgi:hypothetical protein